MGFALVLWAPIVVLAMEVRPLLCSSCEPPPWPSLSCVLAAGQRARRAAIFSDPAGACMLLARPTVHAALASISPLDPDVGFGCQAMAFALLWTSAMPSRPRLAPRVGTPYLQLAGRRLQSPLRRRRPTVRSSAQRTTGDSHTEFPRRSLLLPSLSHARRLCLPPSRAASSPGFISPRQPLLQLAFVDAVPHPGAILSKCWHSLLAMVLSRCSPLLCSDVAVTASNPGVDLPRLAAGEVAFSLHRFIARRRWLTVDYVYVCAYVRVVRRETPGVWMEKKVKFRFVARQVLDEKSKPDPLSSSRVLNRI